MIGEGTVGFKGVDLYIKYEATPFVPEVRYLSNGDPGYPAEGGDFDIYSISVEGIEIIGLLSDETIKKIEETYTSSYANDIDDHDEYDDRDKYDDRDC